MIKNIPRLSLRDAIKSQMAEEVKNCLRIADAVCFDVDSTVTEEECIDELAKFCGKGDEIAKL